MATWKKVIVSGSGANLSTLSVDNLTSGQVVIGGGTGNLSTTAINGTGNIVATTGATGLIASGSFSGSFQGNFIGTTNLPDLTNGTGITAFTYDGATTATVAVSGASTLNTNNISKWTGTAFANSSLTDNGTTITGATSIQLTGANSSLTGSLFGTSSFANNATSASFASVVGGISSNITNNVDNRILTATGGGSINGESNLLFDGSTLTVTGNAIITNNLTVQGTASFQNTTNLEVADRFVLFASGSTSAGDGGIIVQQSTQNVGELFGFDSGTTRWAFTSSFNAANSAFTPDAFVTATVIGTGTVPTAAPVRYQANGNIFIGTDEAIWIYS
jgi:hypothetical protein